MAHVIHRYGPHARTARKYGARAYSERCLEVRFSTSMVMQGAAELLAYGTAVVVEDDGA